MKPKLTRTFVGLTILAVIVIGVSLLLGRYPAPYWMPPRYLWQDDFAQRLVLQLRLPRVLTAFLMGAVLAAAGTVFQMIFRNPLVSSGFLGVSQGAAFGAALSILFLSRAPLAIQATAGICAFSGLIFSYMLAQRIRYGDWALRLVLAGIAISALFSAGVGLLKYVADPLSELPEIVFWMLGGLWAVTWRDFTAILPITAISMTLLLLMRWRLNLLALRDETAFSLGAAIHRERAALLVAAVVATSAMVAVAGIVGWIGLIVPHLARRLVGSDAQYALPASILIGGTFSLICDDIARTLLSGEIPLGIITSLLGALIFVAMLSSHKLTHKTQHQHNL